jgi:hypothetical protein
LTGAAAHPTPDRPPLGPRREPARFWAAYGCRLGACMLIVTVTGGCPSVPDRIPFDPIPMEQAIGIVNANTIRIDGTLWASGHVDGRFNTPDGRGASYHVNGVLFYLAPIYVRFDFKSFGERQFLLGSNAEHFWFYDREKESYHCARHDALEEDDALIPIPPDQIIDALGLTLIPERVSPIDRMRQVQRIIEDYQQILVIEQDEAGHVTLQKEYWLDRYAPRLVRRVVFRDATGAVEMESQLGEYKHVSQGGPLLPHLMSAVWPKTGDRMRFRVNRWRTVPQIVPESDQFKAPRECFGP